MNLRRLTARALAATALVAVAVVLLAVPSTAQPVPPSSGTAGGSSFGIRAGQHGRTTLEEDHFAYDVPAGTSVSDSIIVINHTDRPLQLRLYPADLVAAEGGGFAPAQADAANKGVGIWATLERSTIDLAPSQSGEVSFRIEVPSAATPGEYPGAIVASTVAPKGQSGLAVETRAALIARVRVPGRLAPALELSPLTSRLGEDNQRTFSVTVTNPGNVMLEVPGEVQIESGGNQVERLALAPHDTYVIPGGSTTLTALWVDPPPFGRFVAQAVIEGRLDGRTIDTYRSSLLTITVIPWLKVGLALAAAVLLLMGIYFGQRRALLRRAERRRQAELQRQVDRLLAERQPNRSSVNRRTPEGAPPLRRPGPRASSDPRARRSARPRSGSTVR